MLLVEVNNMDNYLEEIKELKDALLMYRGAIREAIFELDNITRFKNNHLKKSVLSLFDKFLNAKEYEEMVKVNGIIRKKFINNDDIHYFGEIIDYELVQKDKVIKYKGQVKPEYFFKVRNEITLSKNAIDSISKLMSLYTGTLYRIKQMEARKNAPAMTVSIPEEKKYTTRVSASYSKDETFALIDSIMSGEKSIYNDRTSLETSLLNNFDHFGSSFGYASFETMKDAFELEEEVRKLQNKDTRLIELVSSIMEAAINAHDIGINYLMDDKVFDIELNGLMNRVKASKFMNQYEKAYNSFMERYNKLSKEDKDKIASYFEQNISVRYKQMFGIQKFKIVSPNELKNVLNSEVVFKCGEKSFEYVSPTQSIEKEELLKRRTTLMDEKEIVSFYKHLRSKEADRFDFDFRYALKNESEERQEQYSVNYGKSVANLQSDICNIIASRIGKYSLGSLKGDEKEDARKRSILVYKVCKEYLSEKPLFDVSTLGVIPDSTVSLVDTVDIKKDAEKRFYGMSKVQKTLAKMGTWRRYQELMQKDELKQVELHELSEMYRK